MGDKYKGLLVTFENDLNEEAMEMVKQSILMTKGVLDVSEIKSNFDDYINRKRVKHEMLEKIYELFKE